MIIPVGLLYTFLLTLPLANDGSGIFKIGGLLVLMMFSAGYIYYNIRDAWRVKEVQTLFVCFVLTIFTTIGWAVTTLDLMMIAERLG